jgi:CheY-like chemotaxis protein
MLAVLAAILENSFTSSFSRWINALYALIFANIDTYNEPLLALQHFKPGVYGLLIIDIAMPVMDGFRLYQLIKQIDNKQKYSLLQHTTSIMMFWEDIFQSKMKIMR